MIEEKLASDSNSSTLFIVSQTSKKNCFHKQGILCKIKCMRKKLNFIGKLCVLQKVHQTDELL